jgi:hypothetical protein
VGKQHLNVLCTTHGQTQKHVASICYFYRCVILLSKIVYFDHLVMCTNYRFVNIVHTSTSLKLSITNGFQGPCTRYKNEEYLSGELLSCLSGCASVGFARSRQLVLELVQEVVNRKGYTVRVSHGWWDSFRRRHPNS